jgi:hypothetical protein
MFQYPTSSPQMTRIFGLFWAVTDAETPKIRERNMRFFHLIKVLIKANCLVNSTKVNSIENSK